VGTLLTNIVIHCPFGIPFFALQNLGSGSCTQ
jgi:hypothetical protein